MKYGRCGCSVYGQKEYEVVLMFSNAARTVFIAFILSACFLRHSGYADERDFRDLVASFYFYGAASGGQLILHQYGAMQMIIVEDMKTGKGESAEDLSKRSPRAITSDTKYLDTYAHMRMCATAGTETGLGIPRPPLFLTRVRDAATGQTQYHWKNGAADYDELNISYSGLFNDLPDAQSESFNFTAWMIETYGSEYIDRDKDEGEKDYTYRLMAVPDRKHFDVRLMAQRKEVVSNYGAIHVTEEGQEDLFDVPFYAGVAPNWASWRSTNTADDAMGFEQGDSPSLSETYAEYMPAGFTRAHYCQRIYVKNPGATGGVYRTFLGLNENHRYRLALRVNTLAMDAVVTQWSMDLRAGCHAQPDQPPFAGDTSCGTGSMPSGAGGNGVTLIKHFENGASTRSEWVTVGTGAGTDNAVPDITVPKGSSTLTVWIEHSGEGPTTGVGVDWIQLRDLGGNE